jgi:hypothetical protein
MTRQVALPHRARIEAEIEAHIRENRVRWTDPAAPTGVDGDAQGRSKLV